MSWLALAPTLVWITAMVVGLAVTLHAFGQVRADLAVQRRLAPGDVVLDAVARRNVRAEALRSLALAAFTAAGLVVLVNQTVGLPPWLLPWYRWAFTGCMLAGGLPIVTNSLLDARHRRHVLALAMRRRIGVVR